MVVLDRNFEEREVGIHVKKRKDNGLNIYKMFNVEDFMNDFQVRWGAFDLRFKDCFLAWIYLSWLPYG